MLAFPSGRDVSDEGRMIAEHAPFDADGMACETYDADTGVALSGVGWAAGSGLLAAALMTAAGL